MHIWRLWGSLNSRKRKAPPDVDQAALAKLATRSVASAPSDCEKAEEYAGNTPRRKLLRRGERKKLGQEKNKMMGLPSWLNHERYVQHQELSEIAEGVQYLQWLMALKDGFNHFAFDHHPLEIVAREQAALQVFIDRVSTAVEAKISHTLDNPDRRSAQFESALPRIRDARQALMKLREQKPGANPDFGPHAFAAPPRTVEPAPGYGSIRVYHRDA